MNPVLSVIIPVYNGEKTLSVAIDSVLAQTRKDIEIIIVNDGSSDSTKQIIEEYIEKDSRIVFIDKEKNEGLSAARNSGMAVVKGEYFTFIDADDWIEAEAYEKLLGASSGADVIVFGAFHDSLDESGRLSVSVCDSIGEAITVTDKKDILEKIVMLDQKRLFAYTWNKLYKKEFIDEINVAFENQTLIEDYQFNCTVFDKIDSLALTEDCFYHYIKFSEEALTQRYLPEYFEIMDKRYSLMKDLLENYGMLDGEFRQIICTMHIKHVISGIVKNFNEKSGLSIKQQKAVIKKLFKDKNCLEAIKYAKGQRKQEIICNLVFSTKSVFLNFMLAKMLFMMQNSKSNLFDKLK